MIRDNGNFIRWQAMNIQFLEDASLDEINVGYTASKKIGNAVKRNKAKRLLRELARKVLLKYGKKKILLCVNSKKFNS